MKYLKDFKIFESVDAPEDIRIRFTENGVNKFYKLLSPSYPENHQSDWEKLKDVDGLRLHDGMLYELFYIKSSLESQEKPEYRTYFIHYDRIRKEVYLDASEPNYYPTFSSKPNLQYPGNPGMYFKFDKLEVGGISDREGIFEIISVD
jgi:hypothetical protein